MGFRIESEESRNAGLARIHREQVAKLRRDLEDRDISTAEKVRRARVRCKRIRAVLALGRKSLGDKTWKQNNRWWRDAGRSLSDVRDLSARVAALDAVRADMATGLPDVVITRLRAWFELDRVAREAEWDVREALERFAARLKDAPEPEFEGGKHGGDLIRSYERAYKKARSAQKSAADDGDAEDFHEWRKRVKSMGLQARLLRVVHPCLEAHVSAGRELASVLGKAQDIDVVLHAIEADASLPIHADEIAALNEAMGARRDQLFAEALVLAKKLLPGEDAALAELREAA